MPTKPSRAKGAGRISVGIGSWGDPEYREILFPKGVEGVARLEIYARHFGHVEVNSTYYRIPAAKQVAGWVRITPPGFKFDYKLHRNFSISPQKAAANAGLLQWLRRSVQPLVKAEKLGALFLLLPATFAPARHRLEELDALIEKLQPHLLAVELRHRGWVDGQQRARTLEFFRERKLVWVAVDMPRIAGSTMMPAVDAVTNPALAYLRLHGRRKDWTELKDQEARHSYEYPAAELKQIARRVRALAKEAREVHVVANNHAQDFAPKTALALTKLLRARPR